ncbi:hypothetical protein ACFQU7_20610 [Pseudoroseomonas wenyumeiae]
MSGEQLQATARRFGLNYGPAFRPVREVRLAPAARPPWCGWPCRRKPRRTSISCCTRCGWTARCKACWN